MPPALGGATLGTSSPQACAHGRQWPLRPTRPSPCPWEYQDPNERYLLVVFSDPDALAAVRFTSFLRDCRRIARPLAELRALEVREAKRMRDLVAAHHEDLVRNFDPKVVPLRKKLKVMFHPEVLRDMEGDGLL